MAANERVDDAVALGPRSILQLRERAADCGPDGELSVGRLGVQRGSVDEQTPSSLLRGRRLYSSHRQAPGKRQ